MLILDGTTLYIYPITRDYGFAPNPFSGFCTLATCKPRLRKSANIGDWIMGVGGASTKKAKRKCIYLMRVDEKISFDEYWSDERFEFKKPARNGSYLRFVGDNIYHHSESGQWVQEDSHHSNPDGSINKYNLERDTSTDFVLISSCFMYFGAESVCIDLLGLDYKRIRDYRKIILDENPSAKSILRSFLESNKDSMNLVVSDPNDFDKSYQRVDQKKGTKYD